LFWIASSTVPVDGEARMGDYSSYIWQNIDYIDDKTRSDLIEGYVQLVRQRIDDGYQPYFMTFMFGRLRGNRKAIVHQMQAEMSRVYATLLTRVVRNPTSPSRRNKLPIFLAMADVPVVKREKQRLSAFKINDGLHYHSLVLMPPASRLRTSLEDHLRDNSEIYRPATSCLYRIDVRPITFDPGYVTEYALKAFGNGRLSYDECFLVLPRTLSELPAKSRTIPLSKSF
jgi:hypothetical protein